MRIESSKLCFYNYKINLFIHARACPVCVGCGVFLTSVLFFFLFFFNPSVRRLVSDLIRFPQASI